MDDQYCTINVCEMNSTWSRHACANQSSMVVREFEENVYRLPSKPLDTNASRI